LHIIVHEHILKVSMYQEIIKMCKEWTVSVGIPFLMFQRNTWNILPSDAPSYVRKTEFFTILLWKSQNLHRKEFEIFDLTCLFT